MKQLKKMLAAGAGMSLDATAFTMSQLLELADAAGKAHASLTLNNVGALTTARLRQLAALAPGLISFNLG